jgi:hypothetical protein
MKKEEAKKPNEEPVTNKVPENNINKNVEYEDDDFDENFYFASLDKLYAEIKGQKSYIKQSNAQININKAEELRLLLGSQVVDEKRNVIPGSEDKYKLMIDGEDRKLVMAKLKEIVGRF